MPAGGRNTRTGRLDVFCLGPARCPCVARGGIATAADVRVAAAEVRLKQFPQFHVQETYLDLVYIGTNTEMDFLCAVSRLGMALFTTSFLKNKNKNHKK